jgi:hypothetical protein
MENIREIQTEATSNEALPVEDKYADPGEPPSSGRIISHMSMVPGHRTLGTYMHKHLSVSLAVRGVDRASQPRRMTP